MYPKYTVDIFMRMEVDELIGFLKRKGKFMPAGEEFTVDISKVCSH